MEGSVRSTFDFYPLILLLVVTGRAHVGIMQWEVHSCFTHGVGAVFSNSKEGQGGFQSSVLGTMLFDQPNTCSRL